MIQCPRSWSLAGFAFVLCTGVTGCGPITATTAIADATVALEAARGANAHTHAIYEFVAADERLRKAREAEGFSNFQTAINLADASRVYAEKARDRAVGRTATDAPSKVIDELPSGSAL